MADIAIEISAEDILYKAAQRAGVFWTSPTVGYVIYVESLFALEYRKTENGGATWGGAVNIKAGRTNSYDCWADWQTAGDAGTKIHIAYINATSDDIRYVYLDTGDDSVGGDNQIEACRGNGNVAASASRVNHHISITKTRGGNLAVAFRYADDLNTPFYSFYTSPDAAAWTSEASPWEDGSDYILLFPGNEADNQDVWATFWDASAGEISLKTYDDSGDSWSEQSISGSMGYNSLYLQMDGAIRLSDGHLIFAAWSEFDNGASDLMVWDIDGAGSIVAKTNVITNTAEYFQCSIFINQVNDDIYIAYLGGTVAEATVDALYKKSVDGGANWGGEVILSDDAMDDHRWISAGAMKAAWGGKFQPFWFDDDDNDLWTNSDNGVSIVAPIDYPISSSVIIGVKVTASRTWGAARTASVIVGALVTAARALASIRAASVIVGETVTATKGWGRAIASSVIVGEVVTASQAYVRIKSATVVVGEVVTASWGATWTRISSVIVGAKVTAPRVVALTRTASVIVGLVVTASRVLASIRAASVVIGEVVSASRSWGVVATASVIVGAKVTASRVRGAPRTASVIIGVKTTASKVFAATKTASVVIGTLVSADGWPGFIRFTLKTRDFAYTLKSRIFTFTLKVR